MAQSARQFNRQGPRPIDRTASESAPVTDPITEPLADIVIIGGGTAALVAATTLVERFGRQVTVIERGPATIPPLMRVPAGYLKYLGSPELLEMHQTVPSDRLNGRAPIVPVSKVLGGGSAVNAMVYMRGQRDDYDAWATDQGLGPDWGYDALLPHFRDLESNATLTDPFHGSSGPVRIGDPGSIAPAARDFIAACQSLGHPLNPDFNGKAQTGVGIMQHTMGKRQGRIQRSDMVTALVQPLSGNPLLRIITDATVTRIAFEGRRATAVHFRKDGRDHVQPAGHEILLGAGTYNTARLLMLSGIGPAAHLHDHGIPVIVDLPGVGSNLQDHHEAPVIMRAKGRYGYFGQDRGWRMVSHALRYALTGTGPAATTGIEACVFFDPMGGTRPTIQLYCVPIVYLDRDVTDQKATFGMTLTSCLLRPKARGTVRLRSADPFAQPLVDSNFFGHPEDMTLTLAALRHARRILGARPLADHLAAEILPGDGIQSDEDLATFAKKTVKTNYHPSGSARMGPDGDPMAVLDPQMRVRGTANLRVIDCAAIPAIPSANTNAIAMVLGRKAAIYVGEAAQN